MTMTSGTMVRAVQKASAAANRVPGSSVHLSTERAAIDFSMVCTVTVPPFRLWRYLAVLFFTMRVLVWLKSSHGLHLVSFWCYVCGIGRV